MKTIAPTFHGVRYLVTDVKRAAEFYATHLGFTLEHQMLPAFATVALGPLKIHLSGPSASGSRPLPDGGKQSSGGSNRVVLRVKGSQIQVLDPDGNPIAAVVAWRSRAAARPETSRTP